MKNSRNYFLAFASGGMLLLGFFPGQSCRTPSGSPGGKSPEVIEQLIVNPGGSGVSLQISFEKGKSFNHPTFVVWLEDTAGNFIQTLFVTEAFGRGIYLFGDKSEGYWKPGKVQRPASLPYWSHKEGARRGVEVYVPEAENPVPDAYTGATPKGSFSLGMKSDNPVSGMVKIVMEINQTWDWNEFWTNNKFPDDTEYKTSCQPAAVYAATIDATKSGSSYELQPVGRSSHNGTDGILYTDIETLTTALNIARKIMVTVREKE